MNICTACIFLYVCFSGGGRNLQFPSLAKENLEVIVNVEASDDPYGVFSFSEISRDMQVAEDYEGWQMQNATQCTLAVVRNGGLYGEVEVN